MTTVDIKDAESRLAELGRKAENGETVVVTRQGKPAFDLVPHKDETKRGGTNWEAGAAYKRAHGIGQFFGEIPPDFDDPLPEDFLITPLPEDFDKPKPQNK